MQCPCTHHDVPQDEDRAADGDLRPEADTLARYTLVYRKDQEGNWRVFVHHSSEVPVYSSEQGLVSA